jgi:hypothetical protein
MRGGAEFGTRAAIIKLLLDHSAKQAGFCASSALAQAYIRDVRTSGVVNPQVTQENIRETVCVLGWTKTMM